MLFRSLLVAQHFSYIRLYSVDDHTKMVLEILEKEDLPLKVMIGAYLEAEVNNPECGWDSGVYGSEILKANQLKNRKQVQDLILIAGQYPERIFALAVGNEACVSWTDHLVAVETIKEYILAVKAKCAQDRKSTRLNSSHLVISYAVFCLKKKQNMQ